MVSIKNVLCPVDFSEFSRHAFDRAVAIAQAYGAAVTAIHVVQTQAPPPFIPYGASGSLDAFTLSPADRDHLARELAAFVAHDPPVTVPVTHKVIDGFAIAREIVTEATATSADLIVMGTHGRTGFQRLLLGSVTERLLRAAPCPVLTVGEADARMHGNDATFKRILRVDFSDCSLASASPCRWPSGRNPRSRRSTSSSGRRSATTRSSGRRRIWRGIARLRKS